MAEISCWRHHFYLPVFKHLNGSNFWTTCPVWINNPLMESYYVVNINNMCLTTFHVIFLLTSAVFHQFQEKYVMRHQWTAFHPLWCFWYTYWPPMDYEYVDLSKAKKGVDHVKGISGSKVRGKMFFCKNLNNH